MSDQLWELLLKKGADPDEPLSCLDCFAMMTLLAEGRELGVEQALLEALAREHLARCPGCREELADRLDVLEAQAAD